MGTTQSSNPGSTQQPPVSKVTDTATPSPPTHADVQPGIADAPTADCEVVLKGLDYLVRTGRMSGKRLDEFAVSFKERFYVEFEMVRRNALQARILLDVIRNENGKYPTEIVEWAEKAIKNCEAAISTYENEQESLLSLRSSVAESIPCRDLNPSTTSISTSMLVFRAAINRIYNARTSEDHSIYTVLPAKPHSIMFLGAVCAIHIHHSDKSIVGVFMGPTLLNGNKYYVFDIGEEMIECESGSFCLLANICLDEGEELVAVTNAKLILLTFVRHTWGAKVFMHPEELEKHYY